MLQEMKGEHESGVYARSSNEGGMNGVKLSLKSVLVELPGQLYQGVVEVDDGFEIRLKKGCRNGGNLRFGLLGFSQFLRV